MKGVSEAVALTKTNILKQAIYAPKLVGKQMDRANSLTLTDKCHVSNLQKATIDALIA